MTTCLQLNLNIDFQRLESLEEKLNTLRWRDHYVPSNYNGKWQALSLRSVTGASSDIYAMEIDMSLYKDTELLEELEELNSILELIPSKKGSVRLMKLEKDSFIKEHIDDSLEFEDGCVRLHIPLKTNKEALFFSDGKSFFMECGTCWYLDANRPHSVENRGDSERVHLVVDTQVNDAIKKLFQESGYIAPPKRKYKSKSINDDNIEQVIEALESFNPETNKEIIKELRRQQNPVASTSKESSK